jgi:pyridoxal phosphate enzyme (YggS family)
VDSERLLAAIDKEANKQGIVQDILLEVNIGGEESKSGFHPDDVIPLTGKLSQYPNIRVKGLMAIPPISQKNGDNVKFFSKIYNISVDIIAKVRDNGMAKYLSMGMSDDYTDAIACGSTMIRVGTAIFGARDYTKLHQI